MIKRKLVNLFDYTNPRSLGSRLRACRRRSIIELIDAIYAEKNAVRIIDLGGTHSYWLDFGEDYLSSKNIHVTLVNLEPETSQDPRLTVVNGDACNLNQFADASFDLVHSNSVIEHVGDWGHVKAFAAETRRLAPSYYLQTPYFWCPIEPFSYAVYSLGTGELAHSTRQAHELGQLSKGNFRWPRYGDHT